MKLEIVFYDEISDIDTEPIREFIEDHYGVEILEINEVK